MAFPRLYFAALVVLFGATFAAAQEKLRDRVTIKKGRGSRITVRCDIQEYTGKTIILRTSAGTVRSYPASDVMDVKTPQTEFHVKGLLAFTKLKYSDARRLFEQSLNDETRPWVRREILALLVRCALRLGDYTTATQRFIAITKSDPSTSHFSLVPLIWAPRAIAAAEKAQAKRWLLNATEPATRLVAASQLLNDREWGRKAATALSGLMSSGDPRISGLAQAQLWRKRLAGKPPSANELDAWHRHARHLPSNLRGGPYFLLGRGHLARKQNEKAAAAFLWLPLVYNNDHQLAARACLEAADALADVSRKDAAATLYREVMVRFADTEFAAEAAAQRKALAAPANKR